MRARSDRPSFALRQLAALYGVETSYTDIFKKWQNASAESLLAVLSALGADIHKDADAPAAVLEYRRQVSGLGFEPVIAAKAGRAVDIRFSLPANHSTGRARLLLQPENGETMQWDFRLEALRTVVGGPPHATHVSKHFHNLPRLSPSYYRLELECKAGHFESLLIAAPPLSYERPGRAWGTFLPLYALQTNASWGMGDFSDLEALQRTIGDWGGAAVSTLPLFAAFLDEPAEISPYMPASRLFWNEVYVDPRKAPEFVECPEVSALIQSASWLDEITSLRKLPQADPPRLMALKRPIFERMAQRLEQTPSARRDAFRHWVRAHPHAAEYAKFRAVRERLRRPWPEWPARLRRGKLKDSDSDAHVRLYYLYVQWLAEQQMESLGRRDAAGRAGLYLDLPLGVHPHSYDVWKHPELFAQRASAGAPPDMLFIKGQNWGFPPLHPEHLRRTGYQYLIASLRQLFHHSGWIRIDHVMGLHHLFWIPSGLSPREGVYVRYHPEELYAILALESHRSGTVVVGENLGTVPAEVNRAMQRHAVQQLYVLQYQASPNRRKPLNEPPANSTASLNTHDMPPFAGFLKARDLHTLQELALLSDKECAEMKRFRKAVCQALAAYFKAAQPRSSASAAKLARKCIGWLAGSDAAMLLVNLEDLWGESSAQNVPGTSTERPNWQRKARYTLEQFAAMPEVRSALEKVNRLRSK